MGCRERFAPPVRVTRVLSGGGVRQFGSLQEHGLFLEEAVRKYATAQGTVGEIDPELPVAGSP